MGMFASAMGSDFSQTTNQPKPRTGLAQWLPDPVYDVLTYPIGEKIRETIDPIIPDLDLRARRAQEQIDLATPGGGLFTAALTKDAGRQSVISDVLSGKTDQNWLTGFVASSLTSLPEFFGMPAPVESEVFRIQNPWMGLASELVGPGGAYAAAFKISKIGKVAAGLEKATDRSLGFFGKTQLANPVVGRGVKEMLRYTPLELSRLGVGFTVWPENADNLMGDVALGTALNFSLGAGAGAFKLFGESRVANRLKSVVEKNIGLLPTFELRIMKDPLAKWEADADQAGLIKEWTTKVLSARPGQRTKGQDESIVAEKPFWDLGDVGEDAQGYLNQWFKVNSSAKKLDEITASGTDVRSLLTGKPSDISKVDKDTQKMILDSFGFKDQSDLAANFVFPRAVKITTGKQAGRIAKGFDPKANPGLKWFGDEGVLLAQDGEGLFVFAKRMGQKAAAEGGKAPKKHGTIKAAEGDIWFVGKTDRPDLLLPKTHAKAAGVVKDWAMMNARFRPGIRENVFDQWTDTALSSMNLGDWVALKGGTKASGMARIASRMKQKIASEGGVVDSRMLQNAAEGIYDVFVPTARKEVSSPVYGRLWGMLKGVTQRADELTMKIMRGTPRFKSSPIGAIRNARNVDHERLWADLEPVDELIESLSKEELSMVANATQVPGSEMAATLEQLSESGLVSDRAKEVIRQLQEINRRMLDEFVVPALKESGEEQNVDWLAGYIMPRLYRGDFFQDIKHGGKTVYRVSGKTSAETAAIVKGILEEAEAKGLKYSAGDQRVFNELEKGQEFSLENIFDAVSPQGSADKAVQDVVLGGLKRALANRQGIPKVKNLSSLKERSDLRVADYDWTKEEVIKAIGNHNRQLMRFAASKTWHSRWYPELASWGEAGNKVMKEDLDRKAGQLLGIEGLHSKAQNQMARDVFRLPGGAPLTKLAGAANSIMYNMMLGFFNINFALLNVITPLMTTVPWVAFMQRAPAYKQLQYMQALPKVGADGKASGMFHTLDPLKTFAQGLRLTAKPDAAAKALMERAIGDGVLDAQLYENFVGGVASRVGSNLRDSFTQGGGWEFIKALSNTPGLKSEQFSRLIAFNTALALGRDMFGLADEALYRFAKKGTEQSMYAYGLSDRARIMTGPVGSLVGLFKNWQFHYINQMAEYVGLGVRDGVWSPALWMMGMTGAVGGLGAIPLVTAADGLVNIATDGETKSSFEWLQKNWRDDHPIIADGIYFGLPGMLGANLQSSATMPGTDMVQDTANLANVVSWERGKQLWGVVQKMREYSAVGEGNPLTNDNLRAEFIGAVSPRLVSRLYGITEQDAVLSMRTGYPTAQGISGTTKLLYGLGLNQTEVDRYHIAGRFAFKEQEKMMRQVRNLGLELSDAEREQRWDRVDRVMKKAMMLGLPISSIRRSADTREERFEGDAMDRYGPEFRQRYNLD